MRTTKEFSLKNPKLFREKLLQWSRQFDEIAWLDSNDYQQNYSSLEAILAVQAFTAIKTDHHHAFDQLHEYQSITKDWIFGYLSYDLKNDIEELNSQNHDGLHFPEMYFFQPQKLFLCKGNSLEMHYLKMVDDEMESDFEEIDSMECSEESGKWREESGERREESGEKKVESGKLRESGSVRSREFSENSELEKDELSAAGDSELVDKNLLPDSKSMLFSAVTKTTSAEKKSLEKNLQIKSRISREQYLSKVDQMLSHIKRGDIYEANFCQEFFAEGAEIEPFDVFKDLNDISIPPFSVFLKFEDLYLMCASPERYLKKTGTKILTQPIKGTARRSIDPKEDQRIAKELSEDPKERSENVMIVDLVRNDLSKVAKKGSVQVEELCKVYSFKQVHQMISTVSAELEDGIPPVEVLRATFPMGSMTGAPKISAMKVIEELEETKRGLYSGAVGYFTPEGDFDFNVVIRSILYNAENKYVSFSVGGAITARSISENEYGECLLKSEAMWKVLNSESFYSKGKA